MIVGLAPTRRFNTGLTLDEGAAATITATQLDFDDAEQSDAAITFRLTALAAHGTLLRNGTALALNGGFTQADINAGRISYRHDGSETLADSFGFSVSDGTGNIVSGQSFALTVEAVNDAPVATAPALVTTGAGVPVAITGLSVFDAETDPTVDEMLAKLVAGNGILTIRTDVPGGVTAGNLSVNNASAIFFRNSVTLAQLNATFAASNGVVFTPNAGYTGITTINLGVVDGGRHGKDTDGDPSHQSIDRIFNVVVGNTAPTQAANTGATIAEGSRLTLTTAQLDFNDPDQSDSQIVYTVGQRTNGELQRSGVTLNPLDTFTQADINAGLVTFAHDGAEAATASFGFTVSDGYSTASGSPTFAITVTPVNDAPFVPGGAPLSVREQEWSALPSGLAVFDLELTQRGAAGDYAGASITVRRTGGAAADDSFGFELAGAAFTVVGNSLRSGGLTFATLSAGDDLVITFTSSGTPATSALVQDVVRQIRYRNTSDAPDTNYTLAVTFDDGNTDGSQGSGGSRTATASMAVTVEPVDDAPSLANDTFSVAAGQTVTVAPLANDSDSDGLMGIVSLGGVVLAPGEWLNYLNGPRIRHNADNTVTLDTTGAWGWLVSPETAAATGASNGSQILTVPYTLAGGGRALMQFTINGVDEPGDRLMGTAGDNVMTGTVQDDAFMLFHGGVDTVSGGAGNDGFYFGSLFGAGDRVDGGAGADDQVGLRGAYDLTFEAEALTGVETLVLMSGDDLRFETYRGAASYDLTTVDANVAEGQRLTINANGLAAGESFTFDGSAETDGSFTIYGSAGTDTLTGGDGSDGFFFGNGNFTAADRVDGGDGTDDQLALRGDYLGALAITSANMSNIETLVLLSAAETVNPADRFRYQFTLHSGVAAGNTLTVQASTLMADETTFVDASLAVTGSYRFIGGAGRDHFAGGTGDDSFYGGLGRDQLHGGAGANTYIYRSAADSIATAADTIQMQSGDDIFDLSRIDANSATAANDTFTYIGAAAFSGVAGELRVVQVAQRTHIIEGDVDGDRTADLYIGLVPSFEYVASAADFIL
jgi:hypothetical protein